MPRLERLLGIALSDGDVAAIRASGIDAPARLGAYYHWYLQKALVARTARSARSDARRLLARLDRSNYAPLASHQQSTKGLLLCVPHHGHYVLSILGLIAQFQGREIRVFYSSPAKQAGNAVFDTLHRRLFDANTHVQVVHDSAKGLAEVIRGLRRGAIVILMPDAVSTSASPFFVSFGGRILPVLLGAAVLARKTGAAVLPAVPRVESDGTSFCTVFGAPIEHCEATPSSAPADLLANDYRLITKLFRSLESLMVDQFLYWQHVRSHFAHETTLPCIASENIRSVFGPFLRDPRIRSLFQPPVVLD